MCRPEVVTKETAPFLDIRDGRHPCVVQTFTGSDYIPNNTLINASQVIWSVIDDNVQSISQHNCCLVVTGPNMGGKSTLMRQTGLIVLLAHLVSGSHSNVSSTCVNDRVAMFLQHTAA